MTAPQLVAVSPDDEPMHAEAARRLQSAPCPDCGGAGEVSVCVGDRGLGCSHVDDVAVPCHCQRDDTGSVALPLLAVLVLGLVAFLGLLALDVVQQQVMCPLHDNALSYCPDTAPQEGR